MPIYEYECPEHGRFEVLRQTSDNLLDWTICQRCASIAELVPSLCSMQPDNMWSGIKNEQGYFTSKKQFLSNLKEKNLERVDQSIIDQVKKKSKNKVKETQEKNAIKTERWLAEELKSA